MARWRGQLWTRHGAADMHEKCQAMHCNRVGLKRFLTCVVPTLPSYDFSTSAGILQYLQW